MAETSKKTSDNCCTSSQVLDVQISALKQRTEDNYRHIDEIIREHQKSMEIILNQHGKALDDMSGKYHLLNADLRNYVNHDDFSKEIQKLEKEFEVTIKNYFNNGLRSIIDMAVANEIDKKFLMKSKADDNVVDKNDVSKLNLKLKDIIGVITIIVSIVLSLATMKINSDNLMEKSKGFESTLSSHAKFLNDLDKRLTENTGRHTALEEGLVINKSDIKKLTDKVVNIEHTLETMEIVNSLKQK